MKRQRTRKPTTPGEVLEQEYLKPLGITQGRFAEHLKCDVKTINRLVNGRTRLTPDMAVRIASAFGTTPEFWMNLQASVDLHEVKQERSELPEPLIEPDEADRPAIR
jgi:addiction module HigA family antidote